GPDERPGEERPVVVVGQPVLGGRGALHVVAGLVALILELGVYQVAARVERTAGADVAILVLAVDAAGAAGAAVLGADGRLGGELAVELVGADWPLAAGRVVEAHDVQHVGKALAVGPVHGAGAESGGVELVRDILH